MMPDQIQITHQPRTMTTPVIRTALERLVELDKRIEDVIPGIEIDNWIDAMDAARAALKAEPQRKGPTDEDLYDLAAEFNGDPVPAMRRALELWGNPLQGAPAPGETPATPPAPVPGDVARPTYLDAIRLARGCHDYSGGHTGAEGESWHGAIDTVVDVLKRAAVGPWDSQTRAVFGVGAEAQAGEVEA